MKKLIILLFCVASVTFVKGQEAGSGGLQQFQSKNGFDVLPVVGDWSIGVDAAPILNFVGGFMGGLGSAPVTTKFMPKEMTLKGKYFNAPGSAFRGSLRIGMMSVNVKTPVALVGSTTGEMVEDAEKTSTTNIVLGAGMEMQRGYKRLVGNYGAEFMFGIGGGETKSYTYGNAATATSGRVLEVSKGSTLSVGIRPVIGLNYFFAPKMSLGIDYGWHIMFSSTGESTTKTEKVANVPEEVKDALGGSTFDIDSDINAAIVLAFYF